MFIDRSVVFSVLTIFLVSGCISKYHIGANVHDDGNALHRPVAKKVEKEMKEFEEECVRAFISCDIVKIKQIANPLLLEKISNVQLEDKINAIKDKYRLNGNYKIRRLHSQLFWLDEMVSWDQYKVFDFILCEYELEGQKNAYITLLINKADKFQLWGFEIYGVGTDTAKASDLKYYVKEIKDWFKF